MKLPAYPKYKPSGVEWLGDVPEKWEVKRSDAIVSADRSQLAPEAFADREVYHYSIPVVQETGVGQIENGDSIASAKQVIKKPVVLVSKLNPRKATICLAKPQPILTLCSTEFVALNADNCELGFLEYLTRSELFRQGLDSKVQSVTRSHQRANPADIYKFWNAWPPREEQQIIADFLNRETARLDALVTKKKQLIERLKEKRTALISRTVTRGLNPKTKLKSSGIAWLGDIPEHWKATKVGYYISILSGFAFPSAGFTHDDSDTRLLRGINVGVSEIKWDEVVYWSRSVGDGLDVFELEAGTLVIGMDRPWISEGVRVAIITEKDLPCLLLQRVTAIKLSKHLCRDYFFRILTSPIFVDYFTPDMTGVSVPHISPEQINNFPIPIPPVAEQIAIAEFLNRETVKIDRMVEKAELAIIRLLEYRIALITATVTGKIDVRKESHGK
ncbi:MAG: restriction endonuclease subunit S [Verrucomicrobiia bacterium]